MTELQLPQRPSKTGFSRQFQASLIQHTGCIGVALLSSQSALQNASESSMFETKHTNNRNNWIDCGHSCFTMTAISGGNVRGSCDVGPNHRVWLLSTGDVTLCSLVDGYHVYKVPADSIFIVKEYSSVLKMEAASSSDTLPHLYQAIWRLIRDNLFLVRTRDFNSRVRCVEKLL
jgi:hypothetical protein